MKVSAKGLNTRTHDTFYIDTVVCVKSLILYRNERMLHIKRYLIELYVYTVGILGNELGDLVALIIVYSRRITCGSNIHIGNIGSRINNTHKQAHARTQSYDSRNNDAERCECKQADSAELTDLGDWGVHCLLSFFDPSSSVIHQYILKLLL